MKQIVDYSKFGEDHLARHAQAIKDIKDYMGESKYKSLSQKLRDNWKDGPPSLEEFKVVVSFAGVEGYPAKAWYNELWGLHTA